ncbi:MAG TPA: NFACT RNA binding domain-containing protein, partial [Chloroflexota bacterium]|nr:NFACT RNA binding domain-containing protein [Chloroflexota bacterium]
WLYASAHPQRARLHLVSARPPRPADEVTPLLLLLRKYVDGGRLDAVSQPELERIARLDFSRRAPTGEVWQTTLVVEVLGRQSNLVLLDTDGTVMDAARRVGPQQSRSRTVLPQQRYIPPPPPDRLDPRWLEPSELAEIAADYAPRTRLRELLVSEVRACSPLLAREVVFRGHGDVDAPVSGAGWGALSDAFAEIWGMAAEGRWAPTVAREGERLLAFAPYPLRSFPEVRPVASIGRALEEWFGQAIPAADSLAARKAPLRQALDRATDRRRAKRFSLQKGLVDEREVARLRQAGEYLLAFGGTLRPGQERFRLEDFGGAGAGPEVGTAAGGHEEAGEGEEGEELALDPTLSAVENARRYFARYAKAKAAAAEVPLLLASTEHELSYLEEALTHLDLAATPDELNALRAEWSEGGYLGTRGEGAQSKGQGRGGQLGPRERGSGGRGRGRGQGKGTGKGRAGEPYRRLQIEGFEVLVGRSGKGNDALISREGHPLDLWLHARGVPGGHVLLRSAGRPVPDEVLRRAAALAAGQSQARGAPSVAVDYTQRRNVARIKGAPPGMVTYRGERTLHVPPAGLSG